MAGIPQNFQAISNVLPTYNFVDIVSGTGYVNFYAGNTVDKYVLSNFTYYSDVVFFSNDTSNFDIDFDTILNRPMDLAGLGVVNVPIALNPRSNVLCTMTATATLRKVTGGVESDIVSNVSSAFAQSVAGTYYDMLSIDLTVPLTHYKIGDTLRLNITTSVASAGNWYSYLACDPKGRTTGWDVSGAVPSQLLFQCPVRLNL